MVNVTAFVKVELVPHIGDFSPAIKKQMKFNRFYSGRAQLFQKLVELLTLQLPTFY